MKSVKKVLCLIVFTLITACLFSGCLKTRAVTAETPATNVTISTDSQRSVPPKATSFEAGPSVSGTSYEYVIYTCQSGSEEIPAVHIAEVRDIKNDRVTGISVHVTDPEKVDMIVKGANAIWDYKAVSAHSGISSIKVAYDPQNENPGFDWDLRIIGKNTNYETRVKNCTEVSSE